MDKKLLVIQSPSTLPEHTSHKEAIDAFCRTNELVLLMQFGDERYNVRESLLPPNAKLIKYSYETLEDSIKKFSKYLEGFGVHMVSRLDRSPLPFIMAGSMVLVPEHTKLLIYDKQNMPAQESTKAEIMFTGEWDII